MVTPKSTTPPPSGGPEPSSKTLVKRYPLLTLDEMERIEAQGLDNLDDRIAYHRERRALKDK